MRLSGLIFESHFEKNLRILLTISPNLNPSIYQELSISDFRSIIEGMKEF